MVHTLVSPARRESRNDSQDHYNMFPDGRQRPAEGVDKSIAYLRRRKFTGRGGGARRALVPSMRPEDPSESSAYPAAKRDQASSGMTVQ